jgi:hypothetical protein
MEYRFFYPITENTFNTKWRTRSDLENRTDIYFVLVPISNNLDDFHLEHGLKLRNKKKLELKKREKRFPNGQEYWIKTIRSEKKISIDDMDSMIKTLKKSNENQLIERLIPSQPMILCYISKFRDEKTAGNGLTQELTGLHFKFIRSNDQIQIGNDLFFETICIEHSNSKLIDEKMIEKLLKDHGNDSINPMGYPEFIFRQYQQTINQ